MTVNIKRDEKIIGFDLDGVIVDHSDAKVRLALEFGFSLTPAQTPSDIMRDIIPRDVLIKIQDKLYCDISNQPLMDDSKEVLFGLKSANSPFYLISRRRVGKGREMAVEILKNRGLWPEVFNDKNVFFVEKPEDKNKVARDLGVTHYIDDETRVLDVMGDVVNRFLFDPFDNFKDKSAFKTLNDWGQLKICVLGIHNIESKP